MKTLLTSAAALLVLLTLSCKKDGPPPTQLDMIAGDGQKVWKISATAFKGSDSTWYQQWTYAPGEAVTYTFTRAGKMYNASWENGKIIEGTTSEMDWRFDRDGQEMIITTAMVESRYKVDKLTTDSLVLFQDRVTMGEVLVPK